MILSHRVTKTILRVHREFKSQISLLQLHPAHFSLLVYEKIYLAKPGGIKILHEREYSKIFLLDEIFQVIQPIDHHDYRSSRSETRLIKKIITYISRTHYFPPNCINVLVKRNDVQI